MQHTSGRTPLIGPSSDCAVRLHTSGIFLLFLAPIQYYRVAPCLAFLPCSLRIIGFVFRPRICISPCTHHFNFFRRYCAIRPISRCQNLSTRLQQRTDHQLKIRSCRSHFKHCEIKQRMYTVAIRAKTSHTNSDQTSQLSTDAARSNLVQEKNDDIENACKDSVRYKTISDTK